MTKKDQETEELRAWVLEVLDYALGQVKTLSKRSRSRIAAVADLEHAIDDINHGRRDEPEPERKRSTG